MWTFQPGGRCAAFCVIACWSTMAIRRRRDQWVNEHLFQCFRKDLGFLDFFATPISNLRELVDNRIFAWVYFYLFLYAIGALCYFAPKQQSFIKWNNKFHQPMCWATENLTPSNLPLLDEELVSVWANEAMCIFRVRFLWHRFSPRTTSLRPPMLKAMWSATHRCSDRWGCCRFGMGPWEDLMWCLMIWHDMIWFWCVCVYICFPSAQLSCHGSWRCVFSKHRGLRGPLLGWHLGAAQCE